jgi:predicted MFS family arabinose efflux permease
MFSVGLLVHAQARTGSFAVAGVVSGVYAVGGAIAAPVLGRLIDRRGQTAVLVASSAVSAAMLIAIGVLPKGVAPPALVLLAGAAGLFTPPLEACVRTLLPGLVSGASELDALFALEATVLELTFVFGPPLALAIGACLSTGMALIMGAVALAVGTVVFSLQPASRRWRPQRDLGVSAAGALRSRAIRSLVAIELATGVVFGATEVGVTATAKHLASAAAAAPLLGLWGAGSLVGGLIATRRGGSATGFRGLAVLLTALALLHGGLLVGTGSLFAMGAIIILAGATIAPAEASVYALASQAASGGAATEAFSWLFTAATTGGAVGAAGAGMLIQQSGATAAFALAGAAGSVAALVAIAAFRALPSTGKNGGTVNETAIYPCEPASSR